MREASTCSSKCTGRTEGCPGMVVWTSVGSSFLCTGAVFFDSWYICELAWSKTNFWINQSEKWTLCGLHAFRQFPFFQFFHFLATPDLIIYVSPHETPNRSMRICSMGPGDFITYVNPNETPTRSMRICSMGPGDLITHVDPKWNP